MAVMKYKDENGNVHKVGYAVEVKVDAPDYFDSIMLASNWIDNTYSFEDQYPHESCNITVEVSSAATIEQFEAFGEAMICGSATSNIATAIGGAPTVDIPVIVKVVGK